MALRKVERVDQGSAIDLLSLECGHVIERTHRGRQPKRTRCRPCQEPAA